jgi:hypothetical protein
MPAPTLARANSQAAPTLGWDARFVRRLRQRRDQEPALSLGKRGLRSRDSDTQECRNGTSALHSGPRLTRVRVTGEATEVAGIETG